MAGREDRSPSSSWGVSLSSEIRKTESGLPPAPGSERADSLIRSHSPPSPSPLLSLQTGKLRRRQVPSLAGITPASCENFKRSVPAPAIPIPKPASSHLKQPKTLTKLICFKDRKWIDIAAMPISIINHNTDENQDFVYQTSLTFHSTPSCYGWYIQQ
jgi:hypothetical protein